MKKLLILFAFIATTAQAQHFQDDWQPRSDKIQHAAVLAVNDSLPSKTCNVDVLLTTDSAKFGVNLQGFTYTDTWEDADIENWVLNVELPKYEL